MHAMVRPAIGAELAAFMESGVSITVGTCDGRGRPSCAWAMGASVDRARGTVTVLVPTATSARIARDVADQSRVAITFSRPLDHKSLQVKGRAQHRDAIESERAIAERYRAAFTEHLDCAGWPRSAVRRITYWPCVALEVEVEELFEQTPGPRAGERLSQDEHR
jgi:hypothetical protein